MRAPKTYVFDIPGPQVGKGRPMFSKYGEFVNVRTPEKTLSFEGLVRVKAIEAGVLPLDRVKVDIICNLPVRMKKYKRQPDKPLEPLVRPDLDNVSKSVTDALNKIAYKDDKHVMGLQVDWHFIAEGLVPFTRVIIEEVKWEDYADCKVVNS